MKSFCIINCLVSLALSITINYPDDAGLCDDGSGNQVIPQPNLPFNSASDAANWLNANQMCYFLFVNEAAEYPDILAEVTDKNTKICWDQDCEDPNDEVIVNDINELRKYVDIHRQEYEVIEFKKYSFKIRGTRYVKLEDGMTVAGFMNGVEISNQFEEEYIFNNGHNTLKRRYMSTHGQLARKLLEQGLIKYAHFAKRVGQTFDFPNWYNNDDNKNGDNVYYIQINNIVAMAILIVVVGITLITFCWSCKIIKQCLCNKQKVYQYREVKPIDADTTDME